jgi:type II secretory pathway component PulK
MRNRALVVVMMSMKVVVVIDVGVAKTVQAKVRGGVK